MNDSEIIKGLKNLRTSTLNGWREKKITEKDLNTISYALDLINRQQTEIDTMKDTMAKLLNTLERANKYGLGADERIEQLKIELEKAKSEAVREFAENLKRKSELVAPSVWATPYRAVAVADIDKLVEGMGCNNAHL